MKGLKQLEEENVRLKRLAANLSLDKDMLQDVMLSSYSKTIHALTSPEVDRIAFDFERAMRTEYYPISARASLRPQPAPGRGRIPG